MYISTYAYRRLERASASARATYVRALNPRYSFARYYSTPSVGAVVPRIVNIDGSSLVTLSGANFAPGTHGVLTAYARGTHGQHCGEPAKAARFVSVRIDSQ